MTNPAYQRALILHQQRRNADAVQELRGSLGINPNDPLSHGLLAICLTDLQEFAEATREAQTAVGQAPQLPFAHFALARVMYNRHFFDEAAAAIGEAISLDPFRAEFHSMLGFIRFEQNKWPSALECADRGLQIDPENEACTNLRAMALVKLGRKEEAAATMQGALQKDPENPRAHANQGWTYLHRGDPKQAMVHFKEALRLDPSLDWARAGMVEALKARNFIYRWLLQYFFFMARLQPQVRWAIVIGGYFAYQWAYSTAQNNPTLAPYLWPVVIAYTIFAILTWLADPLFNLALRLHPQGRYALSRDQRMASNWVALALAAALCSLVIWFKTHLEPALIAALMLGLLVLPLSAIFKCHKGWPRWAMAGITGLLAALIVASVSLAILALGQQNEDLEKMSIRTGNAALYGILIAQFGVGFLASVRPKV